MPRSCGGGRSEYDCMGGNVDEVAHWLGLKVGMGVAAWMGVAHGLWSERSYFLM